MQSLAPAQEIFCKRFYSQKQICKMSGLSRSTLERLEKANKLPPPRRFGPRCKRYPIDLIEKWLKGEDWNQGGAE